MTETSTTVVVGSSSSPHLFMESVDSNYLSEPILGLILSFRELSLRVEIVTMSGTQVKEERAQLYCAGLFSREIRQLATMFLIIARLVELYWSSSGTEFGK